MLPNPAYERLHHCAYQGRPPSLRVLDDDLLLACAPQEGRSMRVRRDDAPIDPSQVHPPTAYVRVDK